MKHEFPRVGSDVPGAVEVLRELVEKGHQIVLFTMRGTLKPSGEKIDSPEEINKTFANHLYDAVYWFQIRKIELTGVNTYPQQDTWTNSPKAYANLYIDDCGVGTPLVYPNDGSNPYVDWVEVRKLLIKKGAL